MYAPLARSPTLHATAILTLTYHVRKAHALCRASRHKGSQWRDARAKALRVGMKMRGAILGILSATLFCGTALAVDDAPANPDPSAINKTETEPEAVGNTPPTMAEPVANQEEEPEENQVRQASETRLMIYWFLGGR